MKQQKQTIHIWAIPKEQQEALKNSDEYGFKKMLQGIIDTYFCPKCDFSPLNYKDESHKIGVCPKCGFEKSLANEKMKVDE